MSKIKKINLGGKVYDIYDATAQRKLVQGSGIKLNEETNEISSYAISDDLTNITNENLLYREYNSNEPTPLVVGGTQVYINYNLSVDEVANIVSKHWPDPTTQWWYMGLSTDFVCMVSASYNDNYYEIDFNGQLVFTNFPETDSNYKGFYGWNPDFVKKWQSNKGLAFDGSSIGGTITKLASDFHLLDPLFSSTPFNIPAENKVYSVKEGKKFELQNKLQAGLGIKLNNLTNEISSAAIVGSSSIEEGLFYRSGGVPNSGYVNNIYLNTSLSETEVVEKLKTLTYYDDTIYYVAFNAAGTAGIGIMQADASSDSYAIMAMGSGWTDAAYVFASGAMGAEEFGFNGWNPTMTFNSIPINDLLESEFEDGGMTFAIGAENNKLSSIFSISLNFGAGKGNGIYYLDNGEQKFLTTEVIKEVSTLPEDIYIPEKEVDIIPTGETLKSIRIDTSKTREEVIAILSQLPFRGESWDNAFGAYSPAFWWSWDQTASDAISTIRAKGIFIYDRAYTKDYNTNLQARDPYLEICYSEVVQGRTSYSITIFNSLETHEFASNNGWNPEFTGEIQPVTFTPMTEGINAATFAEQTAEATSTGNEILKGFMTAVLPGVNKKADKQEDIFYKVTKLISGTSLPVEGYLENIYFNTSLSTEEVVNLLNAYMNQSNESGFAFVISDDAAIVEDNFCGKAIMAIQDNLDDTNQDINFWTIRYVDLENQSFQTLFSERAYANSEEEVNFAGWNPDFSGTINFDCGVVSQVSTDSEILVQVSQQRNEFFAPLISATPFESASDLVYFEDNKPHYLQEKLKAGNGISISEDGTISVSFETAEGNLF